MEYSENEFKELYDVFQTETEQLIQALFLKLSTLEKNLDDKELLMDVFRDTHGLKGAVRMIGFENIQNLLHLVEDIISGVRDNLIRINADIVMDLSGTIELVSEYIQESIRRKREFIDARYSEYSSKLQKLSDMQLLKFADDTELSSLSINSDANVSVPLSIQDHINNLFSQAFELLDAIVPEVVTEEIRDLFLIIEELYNSFQGKEFYEVKAPLENVKVKLEFVQSSSCELTISEILDLRNNLGIATTKYTSFCMERQNVVSFPEIAEKIYTRHKEYNPSILLQIKNVFANSYLFPIFAIGLAMNQAVHID